MRWFFIIFLGLFVGFIVTEAAKDALMGESYGLKIGTYNVVQVLGESKETDEPGRELLVSDLDDPNDHHFVVVSDKCFETNDDVDADLLTVVSDDYCIWTRRQPESP